GPRMPPEEAVVGVGHDAVAVGHQWDTAGDGPSVRGERDPAPLVVVDAVLGGATSAALTEGGQLGGVGAGGLHRGLAGTQRRTALLVDRHHAVVVVEDHLDPVAGWGLGGEVVVEADQL